MRLEPGAQAPPFEAFSLDGSPVSLQSLRGKTVLLKFYRFASCPICNLHLHRFANDLPRLEAAGVQPVVFFHSPESKFDLTPEEMPPFPLVADPERRIFALYGVERGWRGMVAPAVMRDYIAAMRAGYPAGMTSSDGGINGLPADFIVDPDGRLLVARYGRHYADSMTVDDVLAALDATSPRAAGGP